jgi:hypothetical protein
LAPLFLPLPDFRLDIASGFEDAVVNGVLSGAAAHVYQSLVC